MGYFDGDSLVVRTGYMVPAKQPANLPIKPVPLAKKQPPKINNATPVILPQRNANTRKATPVRLAPTPRNMMPTMIKTGEVKPMTYAEKQAFINKLSGKY